MTLKKIIRPLIILTMLAYCHGFAQVKEILIFSKTAGYRHKSIDTGIEAIKALGKANKFKVYATEDARYFNNDSLKKYDAVIFLSTTGDILNKSQEESFKKFVNNGGGFIGIHAATDTEYDWPWYNKLVGAYFKTHPPGVHEAQIDILNHKHESTKNLPKRWTHKDEWYDFKDISSAIKVLANLDETTYKGGGNGKNHPISWYQEYDGGRMFYTGLGHTKEAYSDKHFLSHILGGIQYVMRK